MARSTDVTSAATWVPGVEQQGPYVLAASVCDSKGEFLAGAVRSVNMAVTPAVTLNGVTEGQTITGAADLSAGLNFTAAGIIYEFINSADGSSSRTGILDPQGIYSYNPTAVSYTHLFLGGYGLAPVDHSGGLRRRSGGADGGIRSR